MLHQDQTRLLVGLTRTTVEYYGGDTLVFGEGNRPRLTRLARVGALALAKDRERISAYMIGETRGKA